MSFEEAVALQPQWVQIWVNVMGLATAGAFIAFLFSRPTWRDAGILLAVTAIAILLMQWLYAQFGYTRLLGLAHIVVWTPYIIYLWRRQKNPVIRKPFRIVMWALIAIYALSLVFDYADVIRYLLGERQDMAAPA